MIYTARFIRDQGYVIILSHDGDVMGTEIPAFSLNDAVNQLEDNGYVIIRQYEVSEPGCVDFEVELDD